MKLYQKPCARVNSRFMIWGNENTEFKISHYAINFTINVNENSCEVRIIGHVRNYTETKMRDETTLFLVSFDFVSK